MYVLKYVGDKYGVRGSRFSRFFGRYKNVPQEVDEEDDGEDERKGIQSIRKRKGIQSIRGLTLGTRIINGLFGQLNANL